MGNSLKQLEFTIPVYYTIVKKTKPSTTHLIGSNFLRNVHFHVKNKIKQDTAKLITDQIVEPITLKSPYKVTYTYYYKNKATDLMNVVSASSKIFLDALQSSSVNVIENDTVSHCIEEKAVVGGLDKLNPRVEIIIEEV